MWRFFGSICFSPFSSRVVGLWWPPLSHPAGIKSWELHERCWYFSFGIILYLTVLLHLISEASLLSTYLTDDWTIHLLFRVVTLPMPLVSGWPLYSSWLTLKPTNLAWTSCTMLPRWGGLLGWTLFTEENIYEIKKGLLSCYASLQLTDLFFCVFFYPSPLASTGHWYGVADLSQPAWTYRDGIKVVIISTLTVILLNIVC